MEELPPLPPGYIYAKRKLTNKVFIIVEGMLEKYSHIYERIDKEADKAEKQEVEKPIKPKSREELGGMSMSAIRKMPNFKSVKEKEFKTKEEAVKEVIKVQEEEKKEEKSE